MSSAGTITVDFAAETAKFTAELKKVNDRLKGMETGFVDLKRIGEVALGFMSAGAIVSFASRMFEAADAVGDMAARLGVATSELSRLKYAGNQVDVSFESLSVGIKQMQKHLSDAADGAGASEQVFQKLGLSASELKNLGLEDQIKAVAESFKSVKNPADQTRIAMELFGKSGVDMVPLLNQGADGIAQLTSKADALGATVNDKTAAVIDALDKKMKSMADTAGGIASRAIASLAADFVTVDSKAVQLALDIDNLRKAQIRLITPEEPTFTTAATWKMFDEMGERMKALELRQKELARMEHGGKSLSGGPDHRFTGRLSNSEREAATLGEVQVTATHVDTNSNAVFMQGMLDQQQRVDQQIETEQMQRNERRLQSEQLVQNKMLEGITLEAYQVQNVTGEWETAYRYRDTLVDESVENMRQAGLAELAITADTQNKKMQADRAAAQQTAALNNLTLGWAAQNLNKMGSLGRAAAIASVALQKKEALTSIFMDTRKAVMKAWGQGGIYGFAGAAAMAAIGAAQAAAVTGISFGGGGSDTSPGASVNTSPGSSVNPVFTQQVDNQQAADSKAAPQKAVQIFIEGPIMSGQETSAWLIDQLKEAINDRDVVVINGNSAQARELVPT